MENNSQVITRLWIVAIVLGIATTVVTVRLANFQLIEWSELKADAQAELSWPQVLKPERGYIFDRNGNILAAPGNDYAIGVDVSLLGNDMEMVASELALRLEIPRNEIIPKILDAQTNPNILYVPLKHRISPQIKEEIEVLELPGVKFDPVARRQYPNGDFMCHTLGFVDFDGIGGSGIEAEYQDELAGVAVAGDISVVPSQSDDGLQARRGQNLVLTIERNIQYTVEQHLKDALEEYQAESGSIVVMDPRTGAVLANANFPCYDPFAYYEAPEGVLSNPAVSRQYEPGSVMKLVTMAAALDAGVVVPQSTYNDTGVLLFGGHPIKNAEEGIYGPTDMAGILYNSLNTGTAWLAGLMGGDTYYGYLERFGFGRPTGVDLALEAGGQFSTPGDDTWTEASLATNAFGQGIAVTPMQMTSAIAALANGGKQMQPYILESITQGDEVVYERPDPVPQSIPISAETARQLSAMAIASGSAHTEMPGYTIAGKTGTAQIPEGGIYHPTDVIASFVGWLPADAPEFVMLVKIDRPKIGEWGSETAAPTFVKLAQELVVLLDIPPDSVRLASNNP